MNNEKQLSSISEQLHKKPKKEIIGADILDLARFSPDTRHMIVFDVIEHECPVGNKGECIRIFLSDEGYSSALESQKRGEMKIKQYASVKKGHLIYNKTERTEI